MGCIHRSYVGPENQTIILQTPNETQNNLRQRRQKEVKIILVGDAYSGKTSLSTRMKQDTFTKDYEATVGGFVHQISLSDENGSNVNVNLWDTAGDERFLAISKMYYRDISGALILFDISEILNFEEITKWINEIQLVEDLNGKLVYIVGNKKDQEHKSKMNMEQIRMKTVEMGFKYFEISCKTGEGLDFLKREMAEDLLKRNI